MLSALASGILLGLTCGLAPGPLLTLVLTQSLQYGWREGCKVAFAPLITDAPIIIFAWILASQAADFQLALGSMSIAGGLFVLYLAVDTIRAKSASAGQADNPSTSWVKGMLVNVLSPHPWLFWMTVGATTLAKAISVNWLAAVGFLGAFYFLLIGSKVMLALAAGRSREFLKGRVYRRTMQVLGVLLVVFAVLLLYDGMKRFGWLA